MFEGDPAPTQPFEDLLNIKSDNVLGDTGTKRVVPWLKNSNRSDYLVIVCDPRVTSPELRETTQSLNQLPKDILSRIIVINADTPAENRRWVKKSGLQSINIYSDEKREWMRSYTALGEDRWSMTMFIIADERLQKIAREMSSISACKTIQNAVKELQAQRL
jgi:peroxiredoxin